MTAEVVSFLTPTDREQVIHLIAISFPLDYQAGAELATCFLDDYPGHHYVLVRGEGDIILGVICLLDRALNYDGLILKVTGCSFMAVHPEHRDFSISAELSRMMFNFQEQHSDVSIGFARKAMDNYWSQFGFTGITNFGSVSVNICKLTAGNTLTVADCSTRDIPTIAALYEDTYVKNLNSMLRPLDLWKYILDKSAKEKRKIRTIHAPTGEVVGYFSRTGNTIEELCCADRYFRSVEGMIRATVEAEDSSISEVHFRIGINHPFSRHIRNKHAYTVNTRFAWNGGHIFRINVLPEFFKTINPVLESRLRVAGIGPFKHVLLGVVFHFENRKLNIIVPRLTVNQANRVRHFWQKLVMGAQDIEDLVDKNHRDEAMIVVMRILFPLRQPQFSVLDQF